MGVSRVATRRVEEGQCFVRVLLCLEELQKLVCRQELGEFHHGGYVVMLLGLFFSLQ